MPERRLRQIKQLQPQYEGSTGVRYQPRDWRADMGGKPFPPAARLFRRGKSCHSRHCAITVICRPAVSAISVLSFVTVPPCKLHIPSHIMVSHAESNSGTGPGSELGVCGLRTVDCELSITHRSSIQAEFKLPAKRGGREDSSAQSTRLWAVQTELRKPGRMNVQCACWRSAVKIDLECMGFSELSLDCKAV